MSLRINDTAPEFSAETTAGVINFHEWIGDGWAILFHTRKTSLPSALRNSATWRLCSPSSRNGTAR